VVGQLREAELEVSDDTAENKGDLRPCPSLPLPLAEAADVYPLPPANVVRVALTEFWYKFSDVRPVLEVKYVDMFGPHKSEKSSLIALSQQRSLARCSSMEDVVGYQALNHSPQSTGRQRKHGL